MIPYERILLPLDGSALAEAVEPYVIPIAKKFGSELILLQVVTPFEGIASSIASGGVDAAISGDIGLDAARKQVKAEKETAVEYLSSVSKRLAADRIVTRTEVVEGAPAESILKFAKEADVSMIGMSTHGRRGLGRAVFGSVADRVLRNSDLPVLIVRPQRD